MARNLSRAVWLAAAIAGFAGLPEMGRAQDATLFVVPVRPKLVQFGLDMTRLRSGYVVTYQGPASSAAPLLHIWDGTRKRWVETELGSFLSGTPFAVPPKLVFLVGTDSEVPAVLSDLQWAPRIVRLASLDDITLINGCHQYLAFQPHEWRWLSGRYDIQLRDENAERRRYGRYGPWGSRNNPPARPPRPAPPMWETPAVAPEAVPAPGEVAVPAAGESVAAPPAPEAMTPPPPPPAPEPPAMAPSPGRRPSPPPAPSPIIIEPPVPVDPRTK